MKSPELMMDILALNRYRNAIGYWESLALARLSLWERQLAKQWTYQTKATGAHYYHATRNKPWRIPSMVLLNGKLVDRCGACLTGPNGFVEIILLNDRGDPLIHYGRFVTKTLHGHVVLVPGYFKRKPRQKRQNENG